MERDRRRWPAMPAAFGVPAGAAALLCLGAFAAAMNGRLSGLATAILCGCVVLIVLVVSEPSTAVPLGLIAWMTAAAFARAPFGTLHPWGHEAALAAVTVGAAIVTGVVAGTSLRAVANGPNGVTLVPVTDLSGFASAIDRRRRIYAAALAAASLPLVTLVLTGHPLRLSLADNLLI